MLLNEPTPHPTRPAAATAAAGPAQGELPAVEVAGAPPRASAEADTVGFAAVEENGADAVPGDADAEGAGADAISTVSLNVAAVKRAVADGNSDATATVTLDVAAIKQVVRSRPNGAAQAPTIAFAPVKVDGAAPDTSDSDADAAELSEDRAEPAASASEDSTSTDLEPSTDLDLTTPAPYLASTDLAVSASSTVAMPETADDVIATIHAAATAVRAADRRARQAAFVKADPWTGLDLHQPPVPAPVDDVLDLLAPVLERPLLVVEQPGLPDAADVVALHRSELEVDFVEPPVVAAGAEPPIPPRYGPGLSVLPHIEFPV